jgi:hypothetical protein
MTVTVISCLYGDSHDRFVAEWEGGISHLDPKPSAVIVATDHPRKIRQAKVKIGACSWKHPQAFFLNHALRHVETDWVWIHDIDDYAFPDALKGLGDVHADVWQMGYERSDGAFYVPPHMNCSDLLACRRNPFVAGSCVRTDLLRSVGGFADLALQDWALWRALAREGATFQSSDRTHFYYRRHDQARGERELTVEHRGDDMEEMVEWEQFGAVAV